MCRTILVIGLTLSLLILVILPSCLPAPADILFSITGEEDSLRQVRGLMQWAGNVLYALPDTRPDTAVSHAGVNPFGVNTFLEQEVEEWKREESLRMIADAGFHWARQEFPWEDIEIHGKGDFEDRRHEPHRSAWDKYDHIVALARQYDVELIVRLSNPPSWTRAGGDEAGTYGPPDDLADWGDYIEAVVSRYRGKVQYYQLWNEPNIYPEWGEQPVDPVGYTALLCEGYRRAKAVDPDVVILSGALAPTVSLDPGPGPALGLNEFVFLQRMYDAGAAACFDVLTVNDYMLWSGPTDRRMRPDQINFSRPVYVRDIMVRNGDTHKPIWISEMNSNAVPDNPAIQGWGAYGQVTPEQQARYAVLAYERIAKEWPWVGVANFWFFKRASDTEQNQAWYYFRMVEPDFSPLPVYHALQDLTANTPPTLYPGIHQEDHWALRYEGQWSRIHDPRAELGTYRRAEKPGATVRLRAEGGTLTLVPGPGQGEIEITVDSGAPRRYDLDGHPLPVVRNVTRRTHDITLTALSGDVGLDGLVVAPPWRPTLWQLAAAAIVVAVVVWSGRSWRKRRAT